MEATITPMITVAPTTILEAGTAATRAVLATWRRTSKVCELFDIRRWG